MNNVYKTASEAAALLQQRYDGPMKGVRGSGGKTYDYISWDDSARQLDKVFGIFGWDSRVTGIQMDPTAGVYMASVEVTARVLDDETGAIITITRSAVGRGTAQPSKDEREQGLTVSASLGTHDTAAATAGSDGFSRACKLLGDAFGLFLYSKEDNGYQQSYSAAPRTTGNAPRQAPTGNGGGGDRRPSEKQMSVFSDRGYTQAQIDALDFRTWKKLIDDLFAGNDVDIAPEGQPKARAGAGRKSSTMSAGSATATDDIPF